MSIDNIEIIKPLLNFTDPGDFYMLYVFKRKKDQPEGEKQNHQSIRTIKSYCIRSIEHLAERYEEVKQLCEMFKARAYIHVNKQNHKNISLLMLERLAQRIRNGVGSQQGLFDSVVGELHSTEKRWIVDIDNKENYYKQEVIDCIEKCQPYNSEQSKIIMEIPTKNGVHLITERFNTEEFKMHGYQDDIQKHNPTCLFIPDYLM